MPKTRTLSRPAETTQRDIDVLTAAGRRLPSVPDRSKVNRSGRDWQVRAWEFYDVIGEYRYSCDWVGAVISKAILYVAREGKTVTTGPAFAYVNDLFGGPESQSQMLREIGIHLTVAGEGYVVGTSTKGIDEWRVIAATELTTRTGKYWASSKPIESDGDPFVMRLWRPHPRKYNDANAPSRAVLPILAELDALGKRITAEIDSRLAGAGVFFVPSEMTLPVRPDVDADGAPTSTTTVADQFQSDLTDAMLTAVADREDASALVPIVVSAPGEFIGNVRHVTFWSPLDDKTIDLRKEAIGRLALGMDMPPEILTGSADVNHWNMWATEEAAIKAHAEPLLHLICESLTEGYLLPLLLQDGMDPAEASRYTIEADTSLLRLRPNRSKEALELYDRMQLDGEALRRETGFSEDDAPDMDELRDLFVRKVASGSTTPELVAAALRALGVPIGAIESAEPAQERPTPSLRDHPDQGPPEQPVNDTPPGDDGLLGASEVIVYRALERAGNRLRTKIGRRPPGVSAAEMYLHVPVSTGQLDDLLEDAFTGLDRFVGCRSACTEDLAAALDAYCRSLLVAARPHDPALLATYLTLNKVVAA